MNTRMATDRGLSGVTPSSTTARVIDPVLRTESDAALLLLRVSLALILFPHGAQHMLGWFGGAGFAGTHDWMTGTVGFPATLAGFAIFVEFVAPFALLAGLLSRVAALGVVGLMTGAASTHLGNGFFMNWTGALPAGTEGFEYHLLMIAIALAIVLRGGGAWSLDRVVRLSRQEGYAQEVRRGT